MDPSNQEPSTSNVNTTADEKQDSSVPTKKVARKYTFKIYLRQIQRHLHPGCKISDGSLTALNSMVVNLFKRIATEAQALAQKQKRPTLMDRDIEFACRLVLPTELQKDAVAAGKKAVTKFDNTLKSR